MFKCQMSGRMSRAGQKSHKIVVETRDKQYFARLRNEDTKQWEDVMVGVGQEIVRELTVTEESMLLWNSWSPEERKLFLLELARR